MLLPGIRSGKVAPVGRQSAVYLVTHSIGVRCQVSGVRKANRSILKPEH